MRYEGNRHPVLRTARVLLFLAVILFAYGGAAESGGSLTEIRITAETGGLFDPVNSTVRPAEVSFVSPSGEKLFTRTVGLALSGGTSREYEHPSLKLIADAFEEDGWLEYTGLCGQEDPSPFSHVEKYRDLKLRTGGQDASESNIRSAVMSRLCGECGFPGYLPEERAVVFLNGEFYETAFDETEKSWIALSDISAEKNPQYGTDAGNDTQDYVFCLSVTEAKLYFLSNEERMCHATKYAVSKGAYVNEETGNCWYWLRTPGWAPMAYCQTNVNHKGEVVLVGDSLEHTDNAIRPVIWVGVD